MKNYKKKKLIYTFLRKIYDSFFYEKSCFVVFFMNELCERDPQFNFSSFKNLSIERNFCK